MPGDLVFCRTMAVCLVTVFAVSDVCAGDLRAGEVHAGFMQPPMDCRPHTRWWWMGNALHKEDITWQLDQMLAQGIGGVEQITMEPVYTRGNHDYLSPEYFDLIRHAVEEARTRGMEFSINFGGPGWIWGGEWVPKEDQSGVMLASMKLLDGPARFSGALPMDAALNPRDVPRSMPFIAGEDRLLKVVAVRRMGERLLADSAVDLSALAKGREITWDVPEGQWQLTAFWLTKRDNADAVDHLSPEAMSRYCETLGAKYLRAVGKHFGGTVESFFSDSFEVPIYRNGLYWSDGLFEAFEQEAGYDLVPWLPALWWDMDGLSPKVRHDVNAFLHRRGMTAFFRTFLDWCERHGVRGRIQPYGFVTDIIEGAGVSHLPEMEITAGEKDAVPWFDTRIGPREYTASGAHLYGRDIVTTEAFTYLHWEPYRETLAELKTATDAFLRAGANKFYNHGFIASPERDGIVPTRGFFAAIRISPENIWWPHYHHLAEYTARSCWLLRQGRFMADVAVYSPLANQWTESVLNARKWTREFDWGGLGALLTANGYGFDLVNDDTLQHRAAFDGQRLRLGEMTYSVLILPDVRAIPLETLRRVGAYARQGGRVIALERVPGESTGLRGHAQSDAEVREISGALFCQAAGPDGAGGKDYGQGRTYFMDTVLRREDPLDWRSAGFDPFLKALRDCVPPDMEIDLTLSGKRTNNGLACVHRRADAMDIYFIANFEDAPFNGMVGFRVTDGQPAVWDPNTGERRPLHAYERDGSHTRMRLALAPFESRFVVFERGEGQAEPPHVTRSDFVEVVSADQTGFTALASRNGPHGYRFHDGGETREGAAVVEGLPAALEVGGVWELRFPGTGLSGETFQWPLLKSWTEEARLRHFSGRAEYTAAVELPEECFGAGVRLRLSLGVVGNVAEIRMNGQNVGVHWMDGQMFSLDGIARPGRNTLEVAVTNTLINRVSGMTAFPEVPEALQPHFGTGIHKSFPAADRLLGFEPLPRSGLLGPVRILPVKEVRVRAEPENTP